MQNIFLIFYYLTRHVIRGGKRKLMISFLCFFYFKLGWLAAKPAGSMREGFWMEVAGLVEYEMNM